MKKYGLASLLTIVAAPVWAGLSAPDYPSCDLPAQQHLVAPRGPIQLDPLLAHIVMRAQILQADISTARKARWLSASTASQLWDAVAEVSRQAHQLHAKQGFLSAAERASEDRALNAVATKLCSASVLVTDE